VHPKINTVAENLTKDTQKLPRLEPGILQGAREVRTLIPPISHIPSLI